MTETLDLAIDPGLVDEARRLGLDVVSVINADLRRRIERRKSEITWQDENREAIEAYNEHIERHGLWYERLRDR